MPHVITSLCLRDHGCMMVCPVECIVPGYPLEKWPTYYIDPEVCVDCGACVPECPHSAIFPQEEVPSAYTARGGEILNRIDLTGHYEGLSHQFGPYDPGTKKYPYIPVVLETVKQLNAGETIDLTPDIGRNADFFKNGPGYDARDPNKAIKDPHDQ